MTNEDNMRGRGDPADSEPSPLERYSHASVTAGSIVWLVALVVAISVWTSLHLAPVRGVLIGNAVLVVTWIVAILGKDRVPTLLRLAKALVVLCTRLEFLVAVSCALVLIGAFLSSVRVIGIDDQTKISIRFSEETIRTVAARGDVGRKLVFTTPCGRPIRIRVEGFDELERKIWPIIPSDVHRLDMYRRLTILVVIPTEIHSVLEVARFVVERDGVPMHSFRTYNKHSKVSPVVGLGPKPEQPCAESIDGSRWDEVVWLENDAIEKWKPRVRVRDVLTFRLEGYRSGTEIAVAEAYEVKIECDYVQMSVSQNISNDDVEGESQ